MLIPHTIHFHYMLCILYYVADPSLTGNVYDPISKLPLPDGSNEVPIELSELLQFVPKMADKWYEIGAYLKVEDCIKNQQCAGANTLNVKMSIIIQAWIDSGKDVSWQTLVDVLENPGVELRAVATDIKHYLYEKGLHMHNVAAVVV